MSTDETQAIPAVTENTCRACGSGNRAEAHYVASPLNGTPVTCTDDWHDEDAREPGSQVPAEDDHEPTLLDLPAVAPAPVRAPAIHCPGCGETFAEAGLGGKALFLADALRSAALTAGWMHADGKWTCSVCIAGPSAPIGPEPAPVSSLPEADGDPYDQSITILAEYDAKVPGLWSEVNQRNSAACHKTKLRVRDARHGLTAIFSRTPNLQADPEAAVALLNYEARLSELAQDMRRESLERREAEERAFEERLAKLREPEGAAA